MTITSKITMDLLNPGVTPIVSAAQDDRYTRELEITLLAGGQEWEIPAGAAALIRFRKADGRGGEYDTLPDGSRAWQAEGNILRIALAPQALTMPGSVKLTVTLTGGAQQISTFAIAIHVEAGAAGCAGDSEDYRNVTGYLRSPEKALAGQLLRVAAVDDRGRVTEVAAGEDAFAVRQVLTPDYTNQIPISVDTDGSLFNGCGWIAGKTLESDGSLIDAEHLYVSGFIPVKKGDIIRIQDPGRTEFSDTVMLALYKADMAVGSGIGKQPSHMLSETSNADNVLGIFTIEGNTAIWDTSTIGYWFWNDFAWLRVTTTSADTIVTVNETITESITEQQFLRPEVKVTEESLDFEVSAGPLAGKTIAAFGDSIFGRVRDSTSVPATMAEVTGAEVHNLGFGGCRMSVHPTEGYGAFSMWALAKAIAANDWTDQDAQAASGSDYFPEQLEKLKGIDFSAVDMAVIHFGTNDYTGGVEIDNGEDPTDCATLCGALRCSIEALLGACPGLRIFVSLPCYRFWPDTGEYPETHTNSLGKGLAEYAEALRRTAAEYNLSVIDCYYGPGINRLNVEALTMDGTHHNPAGRRRIGEFLGGQLLSGQPGISGGWDGYTRAEIDALLGSYITEVDALLGDTSILGGEA